MANFNQVCLIFFFAFMIVAGPHGDICTLSAADILANANSDYRKKGRHVLGLSPSVP
jgi:hypothetical protein